MMAPARPTDTCCAKTSVERDYFAHARNLFDCARSGCVMRDQDLVFDGYVALTAAGFAQDHLRRHARARRARA
jgi:hypothetical protein